MENHSPYPLSSLYKMGRLRLGKQQGWAPSGLGQRWQCSQAPALTESSPVQQERFTISNAFSLTGSQTVKLGPLPRPDLRASPTKAPSPGAQQGRGSSGRGARQGDGGGHSNPMEVVTISRTWVDHSVRTG